MISTKYCVVTTTHRHDRTDYEDQVFIFGAAHLIQRREAGSLLVEYAKPLSVIEEVEGVSGGRNVYKTTIHWSVKYNVAESHEEHSEVELANFKSNT